MKWENTVVVLDMCGLWRRRLLSVTINVEFQRESVPIYVFRDLYICYTRHCLVSDASQKSDMVQRLTTSYTAVTLRSFEESPHLSHYTSNSSY